MGVATLTAMPDTGAVGAERVLRVLIELAEEPDGVSLDELARRLNSHKPTVHRALASLRKLGLATQVARGSYVLGDEFIRLAFQHQDRRSDVSVVQPILRKLATDFGETAHYAVLDGDDVVYRAKVDPAKGAIRLTSTVGGRNPAHRTAVGKVLLAHQLASLEAVQEWLGGRNLPPHTSTSITTAEELWSALSSARESGYAVDDQENEEGVNCLAMPIFLDSPSVPTGAISVSALAFRLPLHRLVESIGSIRAAITSQTVRTSL